jgi:acyl-[acyl-carrier-protein]-phospholipid O-acyltransferase/long-chain-fatty-acid--[acyl-carrier-protein] ligase
MNLVRGLLRSCRGTLRRQRMVDRGGTRLSGGSLLVRSLILRRLLLREVLTSDERIVGILLPPSTGGALVNFALTLAGRIVVNLNYTLRQSQLNACIQQAGIHHVITSQRVLERMPIEVDAKLVALESLLPHVRLSDKLLGAIHGLATPLWLLERLLGLNRMRDDDILTIVFTSGSTGEPKGVMLSHGNVGSNIAALNQVLRLRRNDQVLGVLPFFHSFGYTVTLWGVMCLDGGVAYHFNPLEAGAIGTLCREERVTIVVGTPTTLRNYLKRCTSTDLASVEVVVCGAERLPPELADAFEAKFGVRPIEGYGATELSPIAAINVPPGRAAANDGSGCKEGTVGRPLPGVDAKVTNIETGDVVPPGKPGLLSIRGPNVMKGYLGRPDLNELVLRDDWYSTGDIAVIDEEGFIQITGRQSRFSKIGGEMVPHMGVEDAIARVIESDPDHVVVAVTAVADARRGERLLVLHKPMGQTPLGICQALQASGMPPLWIPSPDSFFEVDDIPLLGTGKIDLKAVEQIARERLASRSRPA